MGTIIGTGGTKIKDLRTVSWIRGQKAGVWGGAGIHIHDGGAATIEWFLRNLGTDCYGTPHKLPLMSFFGRAGYLSPPFSVKLLPFPKGRPNFYIIPLPLCIGGWCMYAVGPLPNVYIIRSHVYAHLQRTKTNIKIFSDPMPGSNERSIQLIGSNAQIVECVEHFLDDISKVRVCVGDHEVSIETLKAHSLGSFP